MINIKALGYLPSNINHYLRIRCGAGYESQEIEMNVIPETCNKPCGLGTAVDYEIREVTTYDSNYLFAEMNDGVLTFMKDKLCGSVPIISLEVAD